MDPMHLLVAIQVYQFPIAVRVPTTFTLWHPMMAMEFLTIDEIIAADRTSVILCLDHFHVAVAQVSDVGFLP